MKRRFSLLMIVALTMMHVAPSLQAVPKENNMAYSQSLINIKDNEESPRVTETALLTLNPDDVTYIYNEDFSGYEEGGFTESPECEVSAGNGEFSVVDNGDGTRSLKMYRSASLTWGMTSISKSDLNLTGTVVVDVRIKRSGKGHFSMPYIYSAGDPNNPLATLAFASGEIKSHFGSTQPVSLMSYEEGRWYECRLILHTDRNEFDIYVDGEQLAESKPYRTSGFSDVDKITFSAEKSNTGTAFIDYIRVGVGYPKELSNVGLEEISVKQTALQQVDKNSYIGYVTDEIKEVNIMPKAAYKGATIMVDGYVVNSGATSRNIILKNGVNIIPVEVISANKKETEHYTVTIIQTNRDEDASLKALSINGGMLVPDFNSHIMDYRIEVPYGVETIEMIPTTNVEGAVVSVNDILQESGKPTSPITLGVGDNTIRIKVVSKDGTHTSEYIITIRRRGAVIDYYKIEGTVERDGGLHVSANISSIVPDEHSGKEYVIFELFKGDEPVSITCMKQDVEQVSESEMYYNMADFKAGNYKVKIYVVDSYNQAFLGKSLAAPITVK